MRTLAIARRAAVAITGIAGILVLTAGTAQAAPAAPTRAGQVVTVEQASSGVVLRVDADDPVMTPQASYTFSHSRSQLLYNAAVTSGVAGLVYLCSRWVPGAVCTAAGGMLFALVVNGLASNECYQLYSKWTPPFWGARIVKC